VPLHKVNNNTLISQQLGDWVDPHLSKLTAHYLLFQSLKSSNTNLPAKPSGTTSTFSSQAFSVSAPSTCNSLPVHIYTIDKASIFKHQLKSHLYKSDFTDLVIMCHGLRFVSHFCALQMCIHVCKYVLSSVSECCPNW